MKLIYADTSTKKLYLGIKNNDYCSSIIINTGYTHTENLAPAFDYLIKATKLENLSKINALVLGSGPGSFTGVRIAYSFFKGLSLPFKIPFIEINTLFAQSISFIQNTFIKINSKDPVLLIPLIFGRKKRFYFQFFLFNQSNQKVKRVSDIYDEPFDSIFEKIPSTKNVVFFLEKEQISKQEIINKIFNNLENNNIVIQDFSLNPEKILEYIESNFEEFEKKEIQEINPHYVRKPDAEINKNK